MSFQQSLTDLKTRLSAFVDLAAASDVLTWDQASMAPNGGGPLRGRQLSTLGRLAQDILVDPEMGRLIDQLLPECDRGRLLPADAACVREAKRKRDIFVKIPSELHSAMLETSSQLYNVWTTAKEAGDFAAVKPLLERSVEQSRRFSDCFSKSDHPMDPLIDLNDAGSTTKSVSELFAGLRRELTAILDAVGPHQPTDDSCLHGAFPENLQLSFAKRMAEEIGYDFNRGRLDLSPHPFMIRFAGDDVRITTRVNPSFFGSSFFGVIHEVGHALYELGVSPALDGTIVGGGVSTGVHESQSRLWENLVARGRPYWTHAYPILQTYFPHFKDVSLQTFLAAINRVKRGLIRVEADELTYNLHVMIRFDCEKRLLEGSLAVRDLPDYWNERYAKDLGVNPTSARDGCMQDVHWYSFRFGGGFQGYAIGNILSAQLYEAAKQEISGLEDMIAQGQFAPLRLWLGENLHRHGATMTPDELILKSTKQPLTTGPYVNYLKKKYLADKI